MPRTAISTLKLVAKLTTQQAFTNNIKYLFNYKGRFSL